MERLGEVEAAGASVSDEGVSARRRIDQLHVGGDALRRILLLAVGKRGAARRAGVVLSLESVEGKLRCERDGAVGRRRQPARPRRAGARVIRCRAGGRQPHRRVADGGGSALLLQLPTQLHRVASAAAAALSAAAAAAAATGAAAEDASADDDFAHQRRCADDVRRPHRLVAQKLDRAADASVDQRLAAPRLRRHRARGDKGAAELGARRVAAARAAVGEGKPRCRHHLLGDHGRRALERRAARLVVDRRHAALAVQVSEHAPRVGGRIRLWLRPVVVHGIELGELRLRFLLLLRRLVRGGSLEGGEGASRHSGGTHLAAEARPFGEVEEEAQRRAADRNIDLRRIGFVLL